MSGVPTTAVFIFGIVLLPSLAHAQQTQPPPPLSSPQAAADPADEFSGRDPLELGDARAAAAPTADAAKTDPLALADSPAETDNALSVEAWKLIDWVLATHDNNDMPFMVIDKVAAEAIAFNSVGERIGVSPALVGMAVGDDETPAVGDREMTAI